MVYDGHSVMTDCYTNANIDDKVLRESKGLLCKTLNIERIGEEVMTFFWKKYYIKRIFDCMVTY